MEYTLAAPMFDSNCPPCPVYHLRTRLDPTHTRLMGHAPFFFQNWYNVERTITLSIVGYAVLFMMLRVSGKRTLSKLNVFDFVFVVAVGSVFASMIISKDVTLVEGIAAMGTLMLIQLVLAELAARFPKLERIINGEPTLLLSNVRSGFGASTTPRRTTSAAPTSSSRNGIGPPGFCVSE